VPIARKHLLPDPLFFRCIFSGRLVGVNGTSPLVGQARQGVAGRGLNSRNSTLSGHCTGSPEQPGRPVQLQTL
jgi:hypothetical protein